MRKKLKTLKLICGIKYVRYRGVEGGAASDEGRNSLRDTIVSVK